MNPSDFGTFSYSDVLNHAANMRRLQNWQQNGFTPQNNNGMADNGMYDLSTPLGRLQRLQLLQQQMGIDGDYNKQQPQQAQQSNPYGTFNLGSSLSNAARLQSLMNGGGLAGLLGFGRPPQGPGVKPPYGCD